MHQISVQQLINHIPKPISQWTTQNVCTWLLLNQIDIEDNEIKGHTKNLKSMSSADWIRAYGVSKFIASQMAQWMEQEGQEFDLLIQDKRQQLLQNKNDQYTNMPNLAERMQKIGQMYQNLMEKQFESNNSVPSPQKQCQKYFKNNSVIQNKVAGVCKQLKLQPKSKSHQYLQDPPIRSQSEDSLNSQNLQSQQNSKSAKSFGSAVSISEKSQQDEIEDQIQSLKSDEKINQYGELQQYETKQISRNNYSDVDKIETPKNANIKQETQQNQQIYENQSISVAKFLKKKKNDTKAFNERLKMKNKQLNSKDPKIHNYISSSNLCYQASINKKEAIKKIMSAQQIPLIQKVKQAKKKHPMPPVKLQSPYVKFVSSEFIPYQSQSPKRKFSLYQKKIKVSTITDQNKFYEKVICGNSKIGRFTKNDIILVDQSVSRFHGEIVPQIQMSGQTKYFLKDIGSRFGTFVQCKSVQQNIQGKTFLISNAEIEIISAQINKTLNNNLNLFRTKYTIDARLRIDRQKQISLNNRTSITIGKPQGNDIRIEDNCQNAKIYIEKDKKICLEAFEGKLYERLKQNELWDIQSHLSTSKKVEIIFGWLKVTFELIQTCIVCGKTLIQCQCDINNGLLVKK